MLSLAAGETGGDLLVDYGFADSRAPPLAALEFFIDEEDANYDDKCDVLENEAGLSVAQPWVLSALQPEPPQARRRACQTPSHTPRAGPRGGRRAPRSAALGRPGARAPPPPRQPAAPATAARPRSLLLLS